jgi:NAD(P)-dependent dehydrogenase (short-subunit alcohol dehydrogenase family)
VTAVRLCWQANSKQCKSPSQACACRPNPRPSTALPPACPPAAAARLGVGEDIVGPALFLASHASDYVTGAELVVDGGGTCMPMLADQSPQDYKA